MMVVDVTESWRLSWTTRTSTFALHTTVSAGSSSEQNSLCKVRSTFTTDIVRSMSCRRYVCTFSRNCCLQRWTKTIWNNAAPFTAYKYHFFNYVRNLTKFFSFQTSEKFAKSINDFLSNPASRQTDGRTDRQTDGRMNTSYRYCASHIVLVDKFTAVCVCGSVSSAWSVLGVVIVVRM